ncbi:MAG: DUF5658 family protein [Chloroflexota bacterium]|nr:DUF5658 family protein [Chloroflexota bacterium]
MHANEESAVIREKAQNKQVGLIRIAQFMAILWVILSLADAGITYICLKDATNIEGNPFARALLSHGEALFYGAKLAITLGVGAGFLWLSNRTPYLKLMIVCLTLLLVMFTAVLVNNILHL